MVPRPTRSSVASTRTRLSFIHTRQRLSWNLEAIAEILAFRERGERPCAHVLSVLDP
jgi:aspartate carbamoyltransferase catalytic subunit